MIEQAGLFKALLGAVRAAFGPLAARRRKRQQLREALWRAVDRAANAVPEDRDPFRTKSFVERDLAAQARRMAKRVDHDLLAETVEAAAGGARERRHAHFAANRQSVERAITKNEKALAERFLEEAL
jgi:hypothetical protein